MSGKTRFKLILICVVAFVAAMFAGCVGEGTVGEFLDGKNALDQSVTYFANGGQFGKAGENVKLMHYPENSYVVYDFADQIVEGSYALSKSGYIFDCWYEVELDAEGKPVYDDNGNVKTTGRVADLSRRITKGEHWYVCAGWKKDAWLEIRLVCDVPVSSADGTVYNTDDVITERPFTGNSIALSETTAPKTFSDATFLQYYTDKNCTSPLTGSIPRPDEDGQSPAVYAKYIAGNWKIVRDSFDVADMFGSSSEAANYYFFNTSEDKTIDMRGSSIPLNMYDFNCRVEGNGFTLEHISLEDTITSSSKYSVFGHFGAQSYVKNLKVKDVAVNVTVRPTASPVSIYLVTDGADESAVFENFAIEDVSLSVKVSKTTVIENIVKTDDGYADDNWLFGGASEEGGQPTDAAFLAKYTGISITGEQLSVRN